MVIVINKPFTLCVVMVNVVTLIVVVPLSRLALKLMQDNIFYIRECFVSLKNINSILVRFEVWVLQKNGLCFTSSSLLFKSRRLSSLSRRLQVLVGLFASLRWYFTSLSRWFTSSTWPFSSNCWGLQVNVDFYKFKMVFTSSCWCLQVRVDVYKWNSMFFKTILTFYE